jgi:hypothetical protein
MNQRSSARFKKTPMIEPQTKKDGFLEPKRVVSVWVRNIIGVIVLAIEGFLAFLLLASVGIITIAFLLTGQSIGQVSRQDGRLPLKF